MRLLDPTSGLDNVLSEAFSTEKMRVCTEKEIPPNFIDMLLNRMEYPDIANASAVFATVNTLINGMLRGFEPTVLICDTAEIIPDYLVFTACGAFYSTSERVALFAQDVSIDREDESIGLSTTGQRGHLRRQLELTRIALKRCRLDTQFRVDPDISLFFRRTPYARHRFL
jgi:hypothetical protein